MTPEQALFARDFLLSSFEHEFATTKRVLSAVPDNKRDYQPHPKSRTAAELTWHLVDSETRLLQSLFEGSMKGMGQTTPAPESIGALISYYETNFKSGIGKLKQLSGEQLAAPAPFFGMNLPLVSYLQFVLNHSVHHRGQLSTYLRPMGSAVPSIYGASGDENNAAGDSASA